MSTVNTFKIRADPEFIAVDKAGTHINVKPYTVKEAEVAWDHDGDVLEVKPKPSRFAFRIVRRIQRLLLKHEVSQKLMASGYKFRGGGYIKTVRRSLGLGGHIHFDLPYTKPVNAGDAVFYARIEALNKMTGYLEGLDILPKVHSSYRHRYAEIETVRKAGDADRLEYRYMCSWLHSPIAAYLCLTAAKITAAHPESCIVGDNISMDNLKAWFERFKEKDVDAARVVERIFEPKLNLEARLDLDLQSTWKSLKQLGGIEGHESVSAL